MNNQPRTRRFVVIERDSQIAPRPTYKDGVDIVPITRRHWKAFMYLASSILDRDYRPTFTEVMEFCGYDTPMGGRLAVKRLERYGLVSTGGPPGTKQSRSTTITEEGKAVWKDWKEHQGKTGRATKVRLRKKRSKRSQK